MGHQVGQWLDDQKAAETRLDRPMCRRPAWLKPGAWAMPGEKHLIL